MAEPATPFNPDVPRLFANFATWWSTLSEDNQDETTPVFEYYLPVHGETPYPQRPAAYVKGWHTITSGDLLEASARMGYAREEGERLAEACARYRQERDEARAVARSLLAFMRVALMNDEEIAAILSCSPSELPTWFHPNDTEAGA